MMVQRATVHCYHPAPLAAFVYTSTSCLVYTCFGMMEMCGLFWFLRVT